MADSLRHSLTLSTGAGTGNELVEVFSAEMTSQGADILLLDLCFMAVDPDELAALATSYPDQLSPALLAVWRSRLHQPGAS